MSNPISSPIENDPTPANEGSHASVSQAARELREAAEGRVHEAVHNAEDKFRDTVHKAKDKSNEMKERAAESARHLRESATVKANALKDNASVHAKQIRDSASDQWDETRVKAKEFQVTAEDYIRQKPTKCVLCALGAGFIIGLLVRR